MLRNPSRHQTDQVSDLLCEEVYYHIDLKTFNDIIVLVLLFIAIPRKE